MYTKTNWIDNETLISAANLNKIEDALAAHDTAIEGKLEKPEADGTQGQILSLGVDGKLTYIDKPADGAPGEREIKAIPEQPRQLQMQQQPLTLIREHRR